VEEVIAGIRYDTEKATLIAHDRYWDGNNYERQGRNTYLYVGVNGNYFLAHNTLWQGERDHIEPITEHEAMEYWDLLPEKEVEYEDAFPKAEVEDA
jgi:hypothetical protein